MTGALVYLHGGAFVNGIQPQHWSLIGHLADSTHREVHVARYPLAPEHDVTQRGDLPRGPVRAVRPGRAAARARRLRGRHADALLAQAPRRRGRHRGTDAHRAVARPVDVNPAADLVERHDPWLTRAGMRPIAAHWVAGRDLTDPTVSPLYGDLTRLPPTLVLVGSRDICRPDCDRLVELAPAIGRPDPARRGRLAARLPTAAHPRGAPRPRSDHRARAAHPQRLSTSRSVKVPPSTGTNRAVSRSAVTCTSSEPNEGCAVPAARCREVAALAVGAGSTTRSVVPPGADRDERGARRRRPRRTPG